MEDIKLDMGDIKVSAPLLDPSKVSAMADLWLFKAVCTV